jgi:hypothetical protein
MASVPEADQALELTPAWQAVTEQYDELLTRRSQSKHLFTISEMDQVAGCGIGDGTRYR